MDLSSSDKYIEENVKEDGVPIEGELELNSCTGKTDQGCEHFQHENDLSDGVHVDSFEDYADQALLPVSANSEELGSPITQYDPADTLYPSRKTDEAYSSHESDMHCDGDDRRISAYNLKSISSPLVEGNNDKVERDEFVGLSHELLDQKGNETLRNEAEPDDLDPYFQTSLLTATGNNNYETLKKEGLNDPLKASHSSNETANRDLVGVLGHYDFENSELTDKEMDRGNLSYPTEMKEDVYLSERIPFDQEGTAVGLHSPLETQNVISSSRSRPDSEERSPHTQPSSHIDPSARQEEFPLIADNDSKSARSPRPLKRKHSFSPEWSSLDHKRASSHDRSSQSIRRRSPSRRTSDSRQRDHFLREQSSPSPRRRESPRRKNRSSSRSPTRKNSSGYRRDHRGRSRSRSPYERDHYRGSPRRRYSTRNRSPYSRRCLPRRPWSPPANRSTGVGRPGRNLFVAGFSYITTERDLEKKFSRFGRVTDVRIVRDRRSGESRGFGFLSLERDEDADAAIRSLDQTEWNGRIVLVEKSKTPTR